MRILILFVVLLASVFAQDRDDALKINPRGCGLRRNSAALGSQSNLLIGSVFNAQIANKGDWGWQVALSRQNRYICGGTLINSQWILTAAHCLENELDRFLPLPLKWQGLNVRPSTYTVKLGINDLKFPENWTINSNVSKIIPHESYEGKRLEYDIALLKLDSPVEYSDEVLPVCLPEGNDYYENTTAWATNYGPRYLGEGRSDNLMEKWIPILSVAECSQKYTTSNPDIVLCAGGFVGHRWTCQNDAGSPLVVKDGKKWNLVGLGIESPTCPNGGLYSRTTGFREWIKDKIQSN